MNILLIEDERVLAGSMIKYLEAEGYHCEWVEYLNQAKEKAWLYNYAGVWCWDIDRK